MTPREETKLAVEREPRPRKRRILLAVTGLSPQVVTESIYALSRGVEPFLPDEVHVVTTSTGAERVRLNLLHPETGWFHRLCRDYRIQGVEFNENNIHRLRDHRGRELDDIRTIEDNATVANVITEITREFTADPGNLLQVSIAGGRKTMGFYAGYALSLFGRQQDRLSHVLVSAPYESHPGFYYPTPYSNVIHTSPPESRPVDTRDAVVELAYLPFVRFRDGMPHKLLSGKGSFAEAVGAAQGTVQAPRLHVDLVNGLVNAAGLDIPFPPGELAFYAWLVERRVHGKPPLACPRDGAPEEEYAASYLAYYRCVIGQMGDDERAASALKHGMDKNYFERHKSAINKRLRGALGFHSGPYLVERFGKRPRWTHGLGLPADSIDFRGLRAPR